MTWLAVRLFLRGTFGKAWTWLTASSVHLLIAALGASLVWGYAGWHGKATLARALNSTKAAYATAQADAARAQIAANQATEAVYRAKAERGDHVYQTALVDAQRRSERFIAGGGVRRSVACGASPAPAAAESGNPAVPASPAADPVVAVGASDVRSCTADYEYALAAHQWAISIAGKSGN